MIIDKKTLNERMREILERNVWIDAFSYPENCVFLQVLRDNFWRKKNTGVLTLY